jgi:antitoxin component YwqK of YwqJK toxin-antitoxin module
MKKLICIILLVSITHCSFGIASDTVFINRKGGIISKDSARFYRVISKIDTNQYKIGDYYLSGELQMVAYNNSPQEVVKKGKYLFYDSLGFISSEGEYNLGSKTGIWKYYYFGTAKIRSVRTFKENQKAFSFKTYDSITQNLLIEGGYNNDLRKTGVFKEYYLKENKVMTILNYENGMITGEALEYYATGEIKRKEIYKNGRLAKGQLFNIKGEKQKYYPRMVSSQLGKRIFECLAKGIDEYKKLRAINGLVIKLTVSKLGKIIDLEIIENEKPHLNEQIIEAISKIKHIKPAMKENEAIDQTITYYFVRNRVSWYIDN